MAVGFVVAGIPVLNAMLDILKVTIAVLYPNTTTKLPGSPTLQPKTQNTHPPK